MFSSVRFYHLCPEEMAATVEKTTFFVYPASKTVSDVLP